jgi:coenzyme F420-0:L-glutamate ligase / coenzyme F420-1:gamma-L-glutamate ligase
MTITLTELKEIPLIRQGDDLARIIEKSLDGSNLVLEDNDILVLAQKIVSKAEGRMVNLATITPGDRAMTLAKQTDKDARLVELILQESNNVLRTRPGTIIVEHKLGFICANAGIDHSNVAGTGDATEEMVLLLPKNPDL